MLEKRCHLTGTDLDLKYPVLMGVSHERRFLDRPNYPLFALRKSPVPSKRYRDLFAVRTMDNLAYQESPVYGTSSPKLDISGLKRFPSSGTLLMFVRSANEGSVPDKPVFRRKGLAEPLDPLQPSGLDVLVGIKSR